jgi:hypothetical protein
MATYYTTSTATNWDTSVSSTNITRKRVQFEINFTPEVNYLKCTECDFKTTSLERMREHLKEHEKTGLYYINPAHIEWLNRHIKNGRLDMREIEF